MNRVRRAETGDIPAILELLVQVDMVHHRRSSTMPRNWNRSWRMKGLPSSSAWMKKNGCSGTDSVSSSIPEAN